MLSLPKAWIQSLVRELRFHMSCSTDKTKQAKKKKKGVRPMGDIIGSNVATFTENDWVNLFEQIITLEPCYKTKDEKLPLRI